MYHSIEEMPKSTVMRSLHVPPKRFMTQMWLLNMLGYKGLSMRELIPYLEGKKIGAPRRQRGYRGLKRRPRGSASAPPPCPEGDVSKWPRFQDF